MLMNLSAIDRERVLDAVTQALAYERDVADETERRGTYDRIREKNEATFSRRLTNLLNHSPETPLVQPNVGLVGGVAGKISTQSINGGGMSALIDRAMREKRAEMVAKPIWHGVDMGVGKSLQGGWLGAEAEANQKAAEMKLHEELDALLNIKP